MRIHGEVNKGHQQEGAPKAGCIVLAPMGVLQMVNLFYFARILCIAGGDITCFL